jgi:hypothetical protein
LPARADQTDCPSSGVGQVHAVFQRLGPGVQPEDVETSRLPRSLEANAAVEPARSKQGQVEHVGPVGRRQYHDPVIGREPVHLHQQLVERLLLLVLRAHRAANCPGPSDGVELVDEDDGRRGAAGLGEQVPHPGRADADVELDEVGSRDREERRLRFSRHGPGQQGLAATGRAVQEDALGDGRPQGGEAFRIDQEGGDLSQLGHGRVLAGHVGEGHPRLVRLEPAGAAADPEQPGPAPVGDHQVGEQHHEDQRGQQQAGQ